MSFQQAVDNLYGAVMGTFGVTVTVVGTGRELQGVFRHPYDRTDRYGVETEAGDPTVHIRGDDLQDIEAGVDIEVAGQPAAFTVVDVQPEREGGLYRLTVREYA